MLVIHHLVSIKKWKTRKWNH